MVLDYDCLTIPQIKRMHIPLVTDKEEVEYYEPIETSWMWVAKYLDRPRGLSFGWKRGWTGVRIKDIKTAMGIYAPPGSGKTYLRLSITEVIKLWGKTNVIIDDRKLESVGMLLPGKWKLMTYPMRTANGFTVSNKYFPDWRTGTIGSIKDGLQPNACPPKDIKIWVPVTYEAVGDELIEELMEWGVVEFYRFKPSFIMKHPWIISATTAATELEKDAIDVAIEEVKKSIMEGKTTEFSLDLLGKIAKKQQWAKRSNPQGKIKILEKSGLISNETTFDYIDTDKEKQSLKVTPIGEREIKKMLTPTVYPKDAKIHIFTTRYLSDSGVPDTKPFVANLLAFFGVKTGCSKEYNKRGAKKEEVFCHLPEAEFNLSPSGKIKGLQDIGRVFSAIYGTAIREDRDSALYHILDTQNVTKLDDDVKANQQTLFFMPGFRDPKQLEWALRGVGRVSLDSSTLEYIIAKLGKRAENRGKAFLAGPNQAGEVWIRPRNTYHFQEEESKVGALKHYRKKYGLHFAEDWVRWDS